MKLKNRHEIAVFNRFTDVLMALDIVVCMWATLSIHRSSCPAEDYEFDEEYVWETVSVIVEYEENKQIEYDVTK